jgi:5-bromo-4-chloroindolyl phosphate hydrolysis protein
MKRLILIIGFLICAVSIFAQETYKLTGELKVKRSESAKKEFLKSKGLKKNPSGYQIELLTIEQHKAKTERELAPYKHTTKSGKVYYSKKGATPYSKSVKSSTKSGYHYSWVRSYSRKK